MALTVDLRPERAAKFWRLTCELDFSPKGSGEPIVQTLFPTQQWRSLMSFGTGMDVGLNGNLDWNVGVDSTQLAGLSQLLPGELQANVGSTDNFQAFLALMKTNSPLQVYLSSSSVRVDENLRNELEKHLLPLEKLNLIRIWHRGKIKPGMKTAKEINDRIQKSMIFLILLSSDYLSSKICSHDEEYRLIINKHKSKSGQVVPVILSPCLWRKIPELGDLDCLPKNQRPISGSREWNKKTAFNQVVEEFHSFFYD